MRQVIVLPLQGAREVGTCNACTSQVGLNGTIAGALVYEVRLLKMTFRVCPECAAYLRLGLRERGVAVVEEAP